MQKIIALTGFLLLMIQVSAQLYTIEISHPGDNLITGHLKLGNNHNTKGEDLNANSLYFIRNGKPWYPVMGEFHFSRFSKEQW